MIDRLEALDINGTKQGIFCRGEDVEKPVVLFVHGGPGSPLMMFSRGFDDVFLKDFVVVHWDQRRAGKSYSEDIALDSLTLSQFVADGLEVVNQLKAKFNRSKVLLVGHSWGTIVASHMVMERPEDFSVYISVGTVADFKRADEMKYEFLRQQLSSPQDETQLEILATLGPPPYLSFEQAMTVSQLLWAQGAVFHSLTQEEVSDAVMKTQEYTRRELAAQGQGMREAFEHLGSFLNSYRAADSIQSLAVPVVCVHGRYDLATPYVLAREFFDKLHAPAGKRWVSFEDSAHFPMYEERNRFLEILKSIKVSS